MKREGFLPFGWRTLMCVLAVLFSMALLRGAAVAEGPSEEGILAIGTAQLTHGNEAAARKKALSEALGRGVEEYLLRRLDTRALADQLSVFMEELVPEAREEIANFHIVGEAATGKHYRVLVRVRINEATLERVLEEKGFLRVEEEVDRFHVTLQGLGSFRDLRRFTQYLEERIPGVESLSQTRFKGDSVTLAVGYREGVDHFLDILRSRDDLPFFAEFQKTPEGEVVVTLH